MPPTYQTYGEKVAHYLSQIDRTDTEGCWPWTASLASHGYGNFLYGGTAHRFGWEYHHDVELPGHLWVLHHCDNRPCQNPDHWFIGGHKANMLDQAMKRRRARLTADQRLEVRSAYLDGGVSMMGLARQFGLPKTVIHRAVRGISKNPEVQKMLQEAHR